MGRVGLEGHTLVRVEKCQVYEEVRKVLHTNAER